MRFVRRVNERGSVTLPAEIREIMSIQDGDFVEFEIRTIHKRTEADA